jgi:hypothetical protein
MKFSFVCVILLLLTPVVVTATRLSAPAEHDDPDGRELRPPPGGISDTRPPLPGLSPISLEECYDVCSEIENSWDRTICRNECAMEECKTKCAQDKKICILNYCARTNHRDCPTPRAPNCTYYLNKCTKGCL